MDLVVSMRERFCTEWDDALVIRILNGQQSFIVNPNTHLSHMRDSIAQLIIIASFWLNLELLRKQVCPIAQKRIDIRFLLGRILIDDCRHLVRKRTCPLMRIKAVILLDFAIGWLFVPYRHDYPPFVASYIRLVYQYIALLQRLRRRPAHNTKGNTKKQAPPEGETCFFMVSTHNHMAITARNRHRRLGSVPETQEYPYDEPYQQWATHEASDDQQ